MGKPDQIQSCLNPCSFYTQKNPALLFISVGFPPAENKLPGFCLTMLLVKPGKNVYSLGKLLISGIFIALNGLYHFKIPENATTSLSFTFDSEVYFFFSPQSFLGEALLDCSTCRTVIVSDLGIVLQFGLVITARVVELPS